jgi:predicted RNA methylase
MDRKLKINKSEPDQATISKVHTRTKLSKIPNLTDWLAHVPRFAFIDRSKRHFVDPDVLQELPLLPYDESQWKRLFAEPPDRDYKKLQLTQVGTYSIGQPDICAELTRFIKDMATEVGLDENAVITETNGGVGGFSVALLQVYNKVNIVELNPTHFKIIKNNLDIYGFGKDSAKKVTIYEADYIGKMLDLSQDIIISDPPWGGRSYAKKSSVALGFSNINITDVINFLHGAGRFKLFIFLAPHNYDFAYFMQNIRAKNVSIRKVRKHNFICVFA